ncbi:MAG: hypothetical protein A4E35_01137 [Methanoregula sp. PtaU1.Bin051]|nr:MAG: hypothetical protein A4E35_01137 [Methanoregula sp. PtaU1.Bin051]
MICKAGFVWDANQHFTRFLEECGITCELITPHMLAAPFFRSSFSCLIIPTGFGNPLYSNLLPALRASASRIKKFVENGGNVLVFGAADSKPDAYDWLPFPVIYSHDYHQRSVSIAPSCKASTLIEDYDSSCIECDGTFPKYSGTMAGNTNADAVILEQTIGKGCIIVTSIHEYPSRSFIRSFCCSGTQTLF